jgi:hypothetical protein
MAKMNDYSGDYRNDFDISDLSKEALIRLIGAYKEIYGGMLLEYVKGIRGELGNKATNEEVHTMFVEAGNKTIAKVVIPDLKQALNLQDDEAVEYIYYQICCDVEGLKKGYYGDSKKIQNFLSNYPKDFDFSGLSQEQCVNVVRSFRRIYQGYRDMAGPKIGVLFHKKGIGDKQISTLNLVLAEHNKNFYYPIMKESMKIEGDDVAAMFKIYQLAPDGIQRDTYHFKMEITDRYDITYIGLYCYTAARFEESKNWGALDSLCAMGKGTAEIEWYYSFIDAMNPKIKMAFPLLPPRKSKDDVFCKLRFWVEEKDRTLLWKNGEGYVH